jgi:hypothetical protein
VVDEVAFLRAVAWMASGLFSFPLLTTSLSTATNGRSEVAESCLPGPLSTAQPSPPCQWASFSRGLGECPSPTPLWICHLRSWNKAPSFSPRLILAQSHTWLVI